MKKTLLQYSMLFFIAFITGCNPIAKGREPITLELWVPDNHEEYAEWVEAFQKEYPAITINLDTGHGDDYWVKLPLALEIGRGPDLFYQNIHYLSATKKYSKPYEEKIIRRSEFISTYGEIGPYYVDEQVYYIPLIYDVGVLYYNKRLFKEKGLTKEDLPKTWKELANYKDTFTAKGNEMHLGWLLNYQQGLPLFNEKNRPNVNTSITKESLQFMNVLQGNNREEKAREFMNGDLLFKYGLGKEYNELRTALGEDLGVMKTPSWDEDSAVSEIKFMEVTPAISQDISPSKLEAAYTFIRFMMEQEKLMMDYAILEACLPARISLRNAIKMKEHPLFMIEKAYIDQSIYPGPLPIQYMDIMKKFYEDAERLKDLNAKLKAVQDETTEIIMKEKFRTTEKSFKYYDDLTYH